MCDACRVFSVVCALLLFSVAYCGNNGGYFYIIIVKLFCTE